MKKIFLTVFLMLLAYTAYPQIRVSGMDSISSMVNTDLFWVNHDIGAGTFAHRKISWNILSLNMIDYIDGLSNTWALKQTFSSGATFSAGANGTVIFNDSTKTGAGVGFWGDRIYPLVVSQSIIGGKSRPFFAVYADNFIIVDPTKTDSAIISFDGTTITFDKNIEFDDSTRTLGISGGAQLRSIETDSVNNDYRLTLKSQYSTIKMGGLTEYAGGRHSVSAATTSLTIDSTFILLDATNTATIDTLHLGISPATISAFDAVPIIIMNEGAYNVTFTDTDGATFAGCMRLAGTGGDAILNQFDTLVLFYDPNRQMWVELSRSNN